MNKQVLIIAGDGVEDVELVLTRDVLLRNGMIVDCLYLTGKEYITTSYNLKIKTEIKYKEALNNLINYDAIVFPGGPGIKKIADNVKILPFLKHFSEQNKVIAAICAGPIALANLGILKGRNVTVYSNEEFINIVEKAGGKVVSKHCKEGQSCPITIDGNLITAFNMESTLEFAKTLVNEVLKR